MRLWRFGLLAGVSLLPVHLLAQGPVSGAAISGGGAGVIHGAMQLSPPPFAAPVVVGAPYSARRVREQVQVAADGTRFTNTFGQETLYRDSQGRTRTERPIIGGTPPGSPPPDLPLLVEISDPVANVGYTLETQNRVAHRFSYGAAPARAGRGGAVVAGGIAAGAAGFRAGTFSGSIPPPPPGSSAPAAVITSPLAPQDAGGRPRPTIAHEDLGIQTVEGVAARGDRIVTTWPTGSQGNDRPFQTTVENWYSEELQLTVLSKSTDPRRGEETMRYSNIDRAEPPSSLFAPPPDYKLADETGPFSIEWTRRQ
jgi:hypothetical protein